MVYDAILKSPEVFKPLPDIPCCIHEVYEEGTFIERLLNNPERLCLIGILAIAIITIIILAIRRHKKSKAKDTDNLPNN
jgi:hypothetical protein